MLVQREEAHARQRETHSGAGQREEDSVDQSEEAYCWAEGGGIWLARGKRTQMIRRRREAAGQREEDTAS